VELEHPIPQQISSYQFRLVGDMTFKQFLQVGGGILIGLIIYSTPIIGIIKWPLVITSILLGAALAFLPFQERPLEKWIVAFLKSIYSPTLFYWKMLAPETVFFQEQATTLPTPAPQVKAPPPGYPELALEITPPQPVSQPKQAAVAPAGAPTAPPTPQPPQAPEELEPGLTIFPNLEEAEKTFLSKITGLFSLAPIPPPLEEQGRDEEAGKREFNVIPSRPIKIKPIHEEKEKKEEVEAPLEPVIVSVAPTLAPSRKLTEEFAQFSEDAAPPFPPSLPNVIVGQVMDSNKKIVEGAILEIKDSAGRPVRALKSNKLGHFMIVTPLTNGRYTIEIEKNGLVFDPMTFDALGSIIPPIAIKARALTS